MISMLPDSDMEVSSRIGPVHVLCSRSTPWVWALSAPVACGYVVPSGQSVRIVQSMVCQVIYLNLARHMVATIVGSLDTQGVAKGVGRRMRHSGTKRTGMMHTELLRGSLACDDESDK